MKPYARSREPGMPPVDGQPSNMDDLDTRGAAERNQMSVIGADITITGNIEASVDLHIEGRVKGDVRCATLILGESSTVSGSIYADRVRVSGMVEGSVETKDLAIEATARVTGDIVYSRLRVANGGVIEGQMKCKPSDEVVDTGKLKLVEPKADATPAAEPAPVAVFID